MSDLLIAQTVEREFVADGHVASVTLDYEARFLRRKRLVTDQGWAFLVDLEKTISLNDGDAFRLADDSHVKVIAADEPLMSITGDNLMRLAWHIGNRHTPCQIERDRLVIQCDPVIRHMLEHLGAEIHEVFEPFSPEGGAYGEGRTHSHEHGRTAHAH